MSLETKALIQIATGQANKTSRSSEANWTFYRPERARESLSAFYNIFAQIRSTIGRPEASFLDCGSGDGIAALTANRAGFETVYGIEKNRTLLEKARSNLSAYTKQRKNSGNINFLHGSYYELLPNTPGVIDQARQELISLYEQDGIFYSPKPETYAQALLGVKEDYLTIDDLLRNYLFTGRASRSKRPGIIKRGQLTVDVVYIYPSDVFFNNVFLPQIGKIMKEGSLLTALTPEDDPVRVKTGSLQEKKSFPFPNYSGISMILQVFQKKAQA
ncbi:MAG: class I SAM-dependent methyltransferase [Candidatus Shapirobacteria bacterium]|nr:class I SAM-dependent methyltransferase [Candidatus Shapirobacteria bacterium]